MHSKAYILSIALLLSIFPGWLSGKEDTRRVSFDFYGDVIEFAATDLTSVPFSGALTDDAIATFYSQVAAADYKPAIDAITAYKQQHNPDDWVYYQLVRKAAQALAPKKDNYNRYTLYKWFLLCKSGYDAQLKIVDGKLLFYVRSDEDIFDIPSFHIGNKKYICLNYHDYNFDIDFGKAVAHKVPVSVPDAINKFSYRLTQAPRIKSGNYAEKELAFNYHDVNYHFRVRLSEEVKKMFTNYPVADYQLYFNMPLTSETYNSLIPQLRENVRSMSTKEGVDYLMHFTRYAFLYQNDGQNFGREKRLSPEQTLLYDQSDCEDRAALFYCLVKEVYNLPMIVLAFSQHLSIAVKFDKPMGRAIMYNGKAYSVCEPTPQAQDLPIGRLPANVASETYQVAYEYDPAAK